MRLRKRVLLLLLSAILLYYSFHKINISIFVWFALVPFFLGLGGLNKTKTFFIAYLAGLVFNLVTLYWVIHVTMIGWIALCIYSSVYFGIFALLFRYFSRHFEEKPLISGLAIASSWILLEFFQGFIILGGFGWTLLGYTQYQFLSCIQIADIAGVYGISFVVLIVNIAIWRIFSKTIKRDLQFFLIAILILILTFAYGFFRLSQQHESGSMKIAVVQGNIPLSRYGPNPSSYESLRRYLTLSEEVLKDKADLLVWPETPVAGSILEEDASLFEAVVKLTTQYKIPLLMGTIMSREAHVNDGKQNYLEERYFNSAVLISKTGRLLDYYSKLHLVPFGEYVPGAEALPFLKSLAPIGEFSRGEDYVVFDELKNKFSCLICFEDVFPDLARNFAKNGAQILINFTNDAWFKEL